eukprot:scaffold614_cov163-Amphora_coffeaeformis.AAC.10
MHSNHKVAVDMHESTKREVFAYNGKEEEKESSIHRAAQIKYLCPQFGVRQFGNHYSSLTIC